MKPTTVEKETKKGGSSSSGRPEMEALLRAIRAAKEAAEIRGGSVASYLGARAGAMEATFVSAFLRKCLISWRKVSSSSCFWRESTSVGGVVDCELALPSSLAGSGFGVAWI